MSFQDNHRDTPPKNARTPIPSTRLRGQAAEDQALAYLQAAGLQLLQRNYRTPGRGGGEIDLILRERDGTVVFVEVRSRTHSAYGGAAASITATKQRRIIFAARHYLYQLSRSSTAEPPACRFDALLLEPNRPAQWLRGAFEAQG